MKKKQKIAYPYEFDPKKRKLADAYRKGRLLNFVISGIIIPIGFLSIFLVSGAASLLSDALSMYGNLQVPLFIFFMLWFMTVVEFPFNFYFYYIREHNYKLSNYTLGGWFKDYLKSIFLGYVVSIPLMTGLFYLLSFDLWWVYAGIAFTIVRVVFTYIVPVVLLPFFYKLKPYTDEAHKKRILEIVRRAGVNDLKNIYVADESSKSTKANAMFAGFGNTKRIVLFDTLTNNFTKDEVETVIAHELGHYVNKDEFRGLLLQTALLFPILFIIDNILRSQIGNFGIGSLAHPAIIPLFMLSYIILEFITMPIENTYSRKMEKEADIFALDYVRKPDPQISTEKRLADMGLSELKANPVVEFVLHSHPSTIDRIEYCKEWKKRHKKTTRS